MIPYFGSIYDFMNGFLYLEEGNYGQAILCFLSGLAGYLDEIIAAGKQVNISDNMFRSISDDFGDISSAAWRNFEDYKYALKNGISPDTAKKPGNYGIFPSLYDKYLIRSGETAEAVLDVIKKCPDEVTDVIAALEKGIDPDTILKLKNFDIVPSKYAII